jgi:hypothetical protein
MTKWVFDYLTFTYRTGIEISAHSSRKMRVVFEQKKIKLLNKQHFVENKTEIIQDVLKMQ